MWNSKYLKVGLTAFCTVAGLFIFYDVLFGGRILVHFGKELLVAAKPIIYGAFMAYLLAPVVDFFETSPFNTKPEPKKKKVSFIVRAVSILLTWALPHCCICCFPY